MFNRFKDAVVNVMTNAGSDEDDAPKTVKKLKYPYARPDFLKLNDDEVQVSADHTSRPILVPRDIGRIPWGSGYAEVINAGKSRHNEDQAGAGLFFIHRSAEEAAAGDANSSPSNLAYFKDKLKHLDLPFDLDILENDPLPFTYFSIFDGHAGTGAALMAVNTLHNIIKEKLSDVRDLLLIKRYGLDDLEMRMDPSIGANGNRSNQVTVDSLVIGALESAFFQMDDLIGREKQGYRVPGGCTALVALFFMGKLYVANAGDCRAIIMREEERRTVMVKMSEDFTPITERQRLQLMGEMKPFLIHPEFTHLEFIRRVLSRDLGKQVLYRDGRMKGWAYKTVTQDDLRFPMVFGDGKRARLLATIGVTRGFGDHDLKVYDTNVLIKPFLTAMPEVRTYDIGELEHSPDDVLIMASDGLWDVLSNRQAAEIVHSCLKDFPQDHQARYTSAAQELVLNARGLLKQGWQTRDGKTASGDDITAFVIPLHMYTSGPSQSSSTESALHSKAPPTQKQDGGKEEVVESIPDDSSSDRIQNDEIRNDGKEEVESIPDDSSADGIKTNEIKSDEIQKEDTQAEDVVRGEESKDLAEQLASAIIDEDQG